MDLHDTLNIICLIYFIVFQLNVADQGLQKAKEMSLKQNKENTVCNSTPDSSGEPTVSSRIKRSNQIIISSPESSQTAPSEIKTSETKQPELKLKSSAEAQIDLDSDDEFKISPPGSSEHSSSDSEFKISQISSESDQESDHSDSDEAFKLESEPEEVKKPVKSNSKSKKNSAKSTDNKSRTKAAIPTKPDPKPGPKTDLTTQAQPAKSKPAQDGPLPPAQPRTKPFRPARTASLGNNNTKTINIPSILSQGSVSNQAVSNSPRIGLSKRAKFKPLHAIVKRNT